MLTEFGYLLAWVVYLACAVVLYWALGFVVHRFRPKIVQYFVKSVLAVLLFTPAVSVPDQNLWAPAYLVSIYSYIVDEQILAIQATLMMIGAWCVINLLMALSYLLKRIRQQKTPPRHQPQEPTSHV